MPRVITLDRNGVKIKISPKTQDKFSRPLRYRIDKYEFKGKIQVAFLDRWETFEPEHKSIVRFMTKCGFRFVQQGQVWEINYNPENWLMFTNGEFDDCIQAFWHNPRRATGWDYIEFFGGNNFYEKFEHRRAPRRRSFKK